MVFLSFVFRSESRQLLRRPLLTALVLMPLVIGATTTATIRSLMSTIISSDVGVADPGGLVAISVQSSTSPGFLSPAEVEALIAALPALRHATPYSGGGLTSARLGGRLETVPSEAVGAPYLQALGAAPAIGRFFSADEYRTAAPVVLIGHRTWTRLYAGRADVVGSQVEVAGKPLTIIGVMPEVTAGLRVEHEPVVVHPLSLSPTLTGVPVAGRASYILGRFDGEISVLDAQVKAAWQEVQRQIAPRGRARSIRVEPAGHGFSVLLTRYKEPLELVARLNAVLLVLCFATAGVVLLVRCVMHRDEAMLKRALGATTGALALSAAVQGVIISVTAATLATPLSRLASVVLKSAMWTGLLPMSRAPRTDPSVYVELIALAAVGGLVTAAPAALYAARSTRDVASRDRSAIGGIGWSVRGLVVLQIALAVCVSYAAVVLTQQLYGLMSVSPGYAPRGLVWTRLAEVPGVEKTDIPATYYRELLTDLTSGAEPAAALSFQFPAATRERASFTAAFADTPAGRSGRAMVDAISPGFFATLGTQLERGRDFTWQDAADVRPLIIVNTRLSRDVFGTTDVVGRTLVLGEEQDAEAFEIVGVAGAISPGDPRLREVPVAYRAIHQMPSALHNPILLAREDARGVTPRQLDERVRATGRHYVWFKKTARSTLQEHTLAERISFGLGAIVCVVAWILSGTTLYGLLTYLARVQRRALGVRIALGASSAHVLWCIYREAVLLAVAGAGSGALLALVGSKYLRSVPDATPFATAPLLLAVLLVLVVSALAGWRPARQAARTPAAELLGPA